MPPEMRIDSTFFLFGFALSFYILFRISIWCLAEYLLPFLLAFLLTVCCALGTEHGKLTWDLCEGLEVKEGENQASSKGIKKVSIKWWLQNLIFQIEMTS